MVKQEKIHQDKIDDDDSDKKKGRAQEIDQYIGERLKEIRKKHGLTQEDLAQRLDISFQQIQKYENGKNRISFSKLYELSDYLKVSMDSFVNGFSPKPNAGLSESVKQQSIDGLDDENLVTLKEQEELMRIYASLEDPKLRKNLLNFIKSMVDNMQD
jgi:transcriptional regulator with XRE-family HTH domain